MIYYDKFGDGRLIIKQGHPGMSFYFIVSGSVVVERLEFDPFLNEHYVQKVSEKIQQMSNVYHIVFNKKFIRSS